MLTSVTLGQCDQGLLISNLSFPDRPRPLLERILQTSGTGRQEPELVFKSGNRSFKRAPHYHSRWNFSSRTHIFCSRQIRLTSTLLKNLVKKSRLTKGLTNLVTKFVWRSRWQCYRRHQQSLNPDNLEPGL